MRLQLARASVPSHLATGRIGRVAGVTYYEHPTRGDEAPLTEVKSWGIQGYVQSAGVPGQQYIRLKTGDFEPTGGRAVWVAQ